MDVKSEDVPFIMEVIRANAEFQKYYQRRRFLEDPIIHFSSFLPKLSSKELEMYLCEFIRRLTNSELAFFAYPVPKQDYDLKVCVCGSKIFTKPIVRTIYRELLYYAMSKSKPFKTRQVGSEIANYLKRYLGCKVFKSLECIPIRLNRHSKKPSCLLLLFNGYDTAMDYKDGNQFWSHASDFTKKTAIFGTLMEVLPTKRKLWPQASLDEKHLYDISSKAVLCYNAPYISLELLCFQLCNMVKLQSCLLKIRMKSPKSEYCNYWGVSLKLVEVLEEEDTIRQVSSIYITHSVPRMEVVCNRALTLTVPINYKQKLAGELILSTFENVPLTVLECAIVSNHAMVIESHVANFSEVKS